MQNLVIYTILVRASEHKKIDLLKKRYQIITLLLLFKYRQKNLYYANFYFAKMTYK